MVNVLIGDMFKSSAQTLVNTVNCVGVMGKGIALEFRKRFPDVYKEYAQRCEAHQVRLGEPYVVQRPIGPWVVNFPTKDHWRSVSKLSDIEHGLQCLLDHYKEWGITSMAVPPLGCGQGQLEWRVIGPTLFRYLSRLDIPVELYAPFGTPPAEIQPAFLARGETPSQTAIDAPKLNPAWVALAEVVARIYSQPYHWPIGRTTFQKIAYFGTQSGLPTGLQFSRNSYGPFAPGLKRIISELVNNGVLTEQRTGRMIRVAPGSTYRDALSAFGSDLAGWEPQVERLTDLFSRVRTNQAEAIASVHFVANEFADKGVRATEMDVLYGVQEWKIRRQPPLRTVEVADAIRNLNLLGWITAKPSKELPVSETELVEA